MSDSPLPPIHEGERATLLRNVTFRSDAAPAVKETIMTKVFGTSAPGNQRVSESLDYEPVQNRIFFERMKAAKTERHLGSFGCVFWDSTGGMLC
jgi:hypothetical protein